MNKYLFIYDELMLKEMQAGFPIKMNFVSVGIIKGKMYQVPIKPPKGKKIKKKRKYIIPTNHADYIFGAIYRIRDWEAEKKKFCAYYNNSIQFMGHTIREDLYDLIDADVTPIKTHSYKDLLKSKYECANEISCAIFIGNMGNPRIVYNGHRHYYKAKNLEEVEQMLKETNSKRKEK